MKLSHIFSIIVVSGICSLLMFWLGREEKNAVLKLNKEYDKQQSKIDSLTKELRASNSQRDSAFHLLSTLNNDLKDLRRRDSLDVIEESKIKGRYDNKSSVELQNEMIKKYENQ